MNDDTYAISVEEVWNVIALGHKRLLHNDRLNKWFAKFWACRKSTFDTEDSRELMYPTHELDHPRAFAYVTRKLAYEWTCHIEERNPSRYRNLHLPQRIIGKSNVKRPFNSSNRHLFCQMLIFYGFRSSQWRKGKLENEAARSRLHQPQIPQSTLQLRARQLVGLLEFSKDSLALFVDSPRLHLSRVVMHFVQNDVEARRQTRDCQ